MDRNQDFKDMKEEYLNTEVSGSAEGREKLSETVSRAKKDKRRKKIQNRIRSAAIAAAVLAVVLFLPFTNRNVANAMENIPLIGPFFHVITADYYNYSDSHNQANVKVPKITESITATEGQSETQTETPSENQTESQTDTAIQSVNEDVKAYTDKLVEDFKSNMVKQGYSGLDISYQVVTNSDNWFTLEIMALQTMASGNEFDKYYNINKKTGQVVAFKDLFQEGVDYNTALTNEIRRQMKEQMDAGQSDYWLEDEPDMKVTGFHSLKEDTGYFFNKDGNLVIAFDEYEVGPGYIGAPQFIIPSTVTKSLLKPDIVQ